MHVRYIRLQSLLARSRPADEILVVNKASTRCDGRHRMLVRLYDVTLAPPPSSSPNGLAHRHGNFAVRRHALAAIGRLPVIAGAEVTQNRIPDIGNSDSHKPKHL